jgi:hypothetical protein
MKEWNDYTDKLFREAAEGYPLQTGSGNWKDVEVLLEAEKIKLKRASKFQTRKQYALLAPIIFMSAISISLSILINPISEESTPLHVQSSRSPIVAKQQNETSVFKKNSSDVDIIKSELNDQNRTSVFPDEAHHSDNGSVLEPGHKITTKLASLPLTHQGASLKAWSVISGPNVIIPSLVSLKNILAPEWKNKIALTSTLNSHFQVCDPDNSEANRRSPITLKLSLPPFFERIYIGFSAAPEMSWVKNAGFTSPGSTIGMIAGIQLNDKLFLETGIRRNNLYFKSSGDIYNRENLNLSDLATIQQVNGYNRITEVPLALRYQLALFGKNKITGSLGTNFTLSHQQNYSYQVSRFGNSEKISREYNKAPVQAFTQFSFSTGCERRIGQKTTLRMEGFYKVPIRGMGAGNLPVTSAGLSIGLIRYLK